MLKPADQRPPGGPAEPPIGDLFERLIDDGKAYVRAEVNVAKAVTEAKIAALTMPVAMIGVALFVAEAAMTALAVGVALAFAPIVGPLVGGIIAFVIFAAVAGGLCWWGWTRIREEL